MNNYPWRLRLYHEGFASIRLERPGRWFRFDAMVPGTRDIHIPTGTPSAPIDGILQAMENGDRPTVAALPVDLQSLESVGTIDGHMVPADLDGVSVRVIEAPSSSAEPSIGPSLAERIKARLVTRSFHWNPHPRAVSLQLPDGGRLLHLGCTLNSRTPRSWLEKVASEFGEPDWLIVGIPYGESETVLEFLPMFDAQIVLVTDLVNDARHRARLPTELMTPTVDRLQQQGVAAYPFPPQSSQRFETRLIREPATTP